MKCLMVLVFLGVLVVQLIGNVQTAPHQSTEESEDTGTREETDPAVTGVDPGHAGTRDAPEGQSHEKSREDVEAISSEEGRRRGSEESDEESVVKFPKTESLCPARPEEITKIEAECAEEYKEWKLMRLKKAESTTVHIPIHIEESTTMTTTTPMESPSTVTEEALPAMKEFEELQMTGVLETSLPEDTTTEQEMTTNTEMTTMPTTTMVAEPMEVERRVKRSRKVIKKRSLDSMGQPSIEKIQSFAVNVSVDKSMNLEEKAVGCVKEINEAMIDSTGDIGKKVGCVAQKVITCLNKGLSCPIMKVPQ